MPVNRMRMRPWLTETINLGTIAGLEWIDKEKTMFTIPWKHAARHGWDLEKDACLFQKWAIHTGKHTKGQTMDPKTWKANFRCALNSLPDIEEVKDRSVNKGHHAMRVFRMLPQASKSREKRVKVKTAKTHRRKTSSSCSSSKADEDMDSSDTHSSTDESVLEEEVATQENTVDSSTADSSSCSSNSGFSPCPEEGAVTSALQGLPEFGWPTLSDTLFHRIQVSPDHCTDYEYPSDIIEICAELERLEKDQFFNSHWSTNSSPMGSSDSSADDSDNTPLYTNLSSMLSSDWNSMRNYT